MFFMKLVIYVVVGRLPKEETNLKNHLTWAKIEVEGDGRSIPREVTISSDGFNFFISIWAERETHFEKVLATTNENSGEDEVPVHVRN